MAAHTARAAAAAARGIRAAPCARIADRRRRAAAERGAAAGGGGAEIPKYGDALLTENAIFATGNNDYDMRLSDLKTGESATILKVTGHVGGFRRRIMEMGFVRGQRGSKCCSTRSCAATRSSTESWAYDISLRRSEAGMVVVLRSDDEAQAAGSRPEGPARGPRSRGMRPTRTARRSRRAASRPSVWRSWATPTAARRRFSTPSRAATNTWAITAA